jgi:hypothetical protein
VPHRTTGSGWTDRPRRLLAVGCSRLRFNGIRPTVRIISGSHTTGADSVDGYSLITFDRDVHNCAMQVTGQWNHPEVSARPFADAANTVQVFLFELWPGQPAVLADRVLLTRLVTGSRRIDPRFHPAASGKWQPVGQESDSDCEGQ